eukprot:13489056-Alexandrium_andersonii.AAC.1
MGCSARCSLFPLWSTSTSIALKPSLSACWIPAAADGGWRGCPTRTSGWSSTTLMDPRLGGTKSPWA